MPSLAVLYDPQTDQWLRFCDPVEEIEVHLLDDVPSALNKIEQRVEQEGLFAAGYVSYEAAPAFDDALKTNAASDFPLLRFGLFAKVEQIELPAAPEAVTLPDWQHCPGRNLPGQPDLSSAQQLHSNTLGVLPAAGAWTASRWRRLPAK
jgi:para-aminobenzoate synthetase/4-amino-4-deoxychorismate lyase